MQWVWFSFAPSDVSGRRLQCAQFYGMISLSQKNFLIFLGNMQPAPKNAVYIGRGAETR